jgi:hypothetical protein
MYCVFLLTDWGKLGDTETMAAQGFAIRSSERKSDLEGICLRQLRDPGSCQEGTSWSGSLDGPLAPSPSRAFSPRDKCSECWSINESTQREDICVPDHDIGHDFLLLFDVIREAGREARPAWLNLFRSF